MTYGQDTEELLRRIANIQKNTLNVSTLRLTSLPELPFGLQTLWCSNTQLTSLPELPSGIQELWCYNTQLTSLPELPSGLQKLWCYNTPLILQRGDSETITEYNARWKAWREEQVSKKRCQERSTIIKEDLIAEVWKPYKLEKLLEVGGWDLVEALI